MQMLFQEFLRKDRPWLIISCGLLFYTFYDIYDHISRPESTFEANPIMWTLFSFFSLATLVVVMFLVAYFLNKVVKGYAVVKELIGLFFAVSFHILVSGPLYNSIFWSEDRLYFQFNLPAILILCVIYLFFRIAVYNGIRYLLKRRKGFTR